MKTDGDCPNCGTFMEENASGVRRCPICGRLSAIGVPPRYLAAALEPGAATDGLRSSESIYLQGTVGRGKTYRACAMLREHVVQRVQEHRPIAALFRSLPELLLELRETYRNDSEWSERDVLDKYSGIPLLVLDDIGAEKTTDAVRSSLYLLTDRRANDPRSRTVITSNLDLGEIAEIHGHPIASRIAGMCRIIKLTGPDRRLTKEE